MSEPFEYIKKHYNVPAEIGRRVIVDGVPGIIAKDRGHYIGVNFDNHKPGVIMNCHPTWKVEYGEMGKVRTLTRSQKRYQKYLESDCFEDFKQFLQYEEKVRKGEVSPV